MLKSCHLLILALTFLFCGIALAGSPGYLSTNFTEFYVTPTGSNLNGGSDTNNTAAYFGSGGTWYLASAGIYYWTKAGETFPAITTNYAFASVYPDGTTNTPYYCGRVLYVDDAADIIVISGTYGMTLTPPANSTNNYSIRIGGAFRGPNTNNPTSAFGWPLWHCGYSAVNGAGMSPCVNIKSGTYYTSNQIQATIVAGPVMWCGYSDYPRDGCPAGRPVLFGAGSVSSFVLMNCNQNRHIFQDLIFSNNGSGGTAQTMITMSGGSMFNRCVFRNAGLHGLSHSVNSIVSNCEFYKNGGSGMISTQWDPTVVNSVSHDNTGDGFNSGSYNPAYINCIAYHNVGHGFNMTAGSTYATFFNCDAWTNGGSGFYLSGSERYDLLVNCNALLNDDVGFDNVSTTGQRIWMNCFAGTGTQTNRLGNARCILTTAIPATNWTEYAANVHPWVNPTNDNFSITLPAARAAGNGFFSTWGTNGNTIGYPDVGAAQSQSTATGGGGTRGSVFVQ